MDEEIQGRQRLQLKSHPDEQQPDQSIQNNRAASVAQQVLQKGMADPQVEYNGRGRELLSLYLKHLCLTILTLGIYSFWAGVHTKKYHHLHTKVSGGRFDYHASGGRRLRAFIIAFIILGGLLYAINFGIRQIPPQGDLDPQVWHITLSFIAFSIVLWLMTPIILVGKRRFQMAYTSWNNVRFNFTGSILYLYGIYITDGILMILTLGIYTPWHQVRVRRYMTRHTRIGDKSFQYSGTGGQLFGIHVGGWILTQITFGIYASWWQANIYRYHIENTRFSHRSFSCYLTGGDIFKVSIAGFFIVVCTLGLGIPWAVVMWKKIMLGKIVSAGGVNVGNINAVNAGNSGIADSFGDAGEAINTIGELFG